MSLANIAAVFMSVSALTLAGGSAAAYNPLGQACDDAGANTTSNVCEDAASSSGSPLNPLTGPGGVVADITRILALLIGIAAVIMLIYGGFQFVVGGNNAEQQAKARRTVVGAIVGLIVAALAWSIISLIVTRLL